jgi:hypothetical protein
MKRWPTYLRPGVVAAVLAAVLVTSACGSDDDSTSSASPATTDHGHDQAESSAADELRGDMRKLWADHMQWTYATVDAFFHNADSVQPTLNRLLANQGDIGAAIVPFYGEKAGDQLTELLMTHINEAVPVLEAAQSGDDAALQAALDDWYANAQDVADFLAAADPDNWPQSATRPALEMHIDQTTAYAVDLLQGDYAEAIQDYDAAFDHMLRLADTLTVGILDRFPDRFAA